MILAAYDEVNEMIRPPILRALGTLDRSLFEKSIPLAAAKVRDRKAITQLRHDLQKDTLKLERLQSVHSIREPSGEMGKVLLLMPKMKPDDPSTWSQRVMDCSKAGQIEVVPFDLKLGYDYWDYSEIMKSILPEEEHEAIPTGFTQVGHVLHLNLRNEHLPYKHLIAAVLLDKQAQVRTVINKTEQVGFNDPYRTFSYEVLAGEPDLNVEVHEQGCKFRFDYSKVYWNSRLSTEHTRLVDNFRPGEAVCDVMAGVGPFAIPAAKKRCWVMANDLNPHGYRSLVKAIQANKVHNLVKAFNLDGFEFINTATQNMLEERVVADLTPPVPRSQRNVSAAQERPRDVVNRPSTFSHFVLNLPASALTFLRAFVGIYRNCQHLFKPNTSVNLPLIHVYCFNSQAVGMEASKEICGLISQQLEHDMSAADNPDDCEGAVSIFDVRDVSPNKRMYCATFRLPASVAFMDIE